MGRFCCVKSCKAFWTPVTPLSFFAFPFNNEEMKEKWLNAAPGYKTLSKYSTICSNHFLPEDYTTFIGKRILKKNAVPSIFEDTDLDHTDNDDEEEEVADCSSPNTAIDMKPPMIILYKPNNVYNTAVQLSVENFRDLQNEEKMIGKSSEVSVQTCPRLSGPSDREKELQYKIKILQGRLRRREKLITNMKSLVAHLKDEGKCSDSLEEKFLQKFTNFDLELFKNVANNNNVAKNSKTYTQEMKQFAKTLYSYSPRAYKFVRTKINLPHAATIRRWIAESVNDSKVKDVVDEVVESAVEVEQDRMVTDGLSDHEADARSPAVPEHIQDENPSDNENGIILQYEIE